MTKFIKTRIFLLIFSLFVLSGCLDIEQTIWIQADASAKLQHKIGLYEEFMLMQGAQADDGLCLQFYESSEKLETHSEIDSVALSSYTAGGVFYCEQNIMIHDFAHLEQVQAWALRGSEIESAKNKFQTEFTLIKQEDAKGVFRQHVRNKSADSNKSVFESHAEQITNTLIGHTLSGRYWTTTLHAFKISETNGSVSDNRTATWRVPLYDLLLNQDYALDMQAKFVAQAPWYNRWYKQFWNWISEKSNE